MEVPRHLMRMDFQMGTVAFKALFSILFLALYQPFSSTFWLALRPARTLGHSAGFYLACIGFLVFSAVLQFFVQRKGRVSMSLPILWLLGEFLGITLIYLSFTYLLGYGHSQEGFGLVVRTFFCVALILVIPFLISLMYAVILDDRDEIRLLSLNTSVSGNIMEEPLVNLYDHSGALKISAPQKDIFFIESQDNYVSIHYLIDGQMQNYFLRSSTLEVEAALKKTSIVRCHRSFLVNLNHIKLLRHGTGKATIVLDDSHGTEVPVSRSYYKDLLGVILPEKIVRLR